MTFHYLEDLHTPTRSSGSMRDTRRAFALRNRDRSSPPSSPLPPNPLRARSPSPSLSRLSLWLDTHARRHHQRFDGSEGQALLLCRFLPAFPRDSDGRIGARLFVFERAPVGRGNRVLLSSSQAIKVERFAFPDRFWIIIIVTTYYKFIRAVCWNGLDDFFSFFSFLRYDVATTVAFAADILIKPRSLLLARPCSRRAVL